MSNAKRRGWNHSRGSVWSPIWLLSGAHTSLSRLQPPCTISTPVHRHPLQLASPLSDFSLALFSFSIASFSIDRMNSCHSTFWILYPIDHTVSQLLRRTSTFPFISSCLLIRHPLNYCTNTHPTLRRSQRERSNVHDDANERTKVYKVVPSLQTTKTTRRSHNNHQSRLIKSYRKITLEQRDVSKTQRQRQERLWE